MFAALARAEAQLVTCTHDLNHLLERQREAVALSVAGSSSGGAGGSSSSSGGGSGVGNSGLWLISLWHNSLLVCSHAALRCR